MKTPCLLVILWLPSICAAQGLLSSPPPPPPVEERTVPASLPASIPGVPVATLQVVKPDAAKLNVKTQATAPDLLLVYPVANAEPGQAGWIPLDAVVVDKRKGIWLKRTVDLEMAPSKECPYYVQLDTNGWTLWILSGHTKLRVASDSMMVALLPDLIPVAGLRKKLTE